MKNILTLTDFSDTAENAVATAFALAAERCGDLFIFHNIAEGELVSYELDNSNDVDLMVEKTIDVEGNIESWKTQAKDKGINATYLIGGGNIQEAVSDIVKKFEIDIVVMGSRGKGKKEAEWGSTTVKVVKQVDVPVLVIKQKLDTIHFHNIVYASTFNVEDRKDFKYFLHILQPKKEAVIHLLSVDTSSYFSQPTIVMREAMKDFADLAYPHTCKIHFYPDYSVDAGIRHFLDDMQPDLLVMSNKHDKPIRHALRGSHTIKSVKDYEIPILTIDFIDQD